MASPANLDHSSVLEATWSAFRAQMAAGNEHLVLPDNLPNNIVSTIADRYSSLIDCPVSTIAVPSLEIIRFTPYADATPLTTSPTASPSFASPASFSDSPGRKRKADKISRPPNAFILYRQAWHPIIKKENPEIANNDISKKVGAMWKNEEEHIKAAWKTRADDVKKEHMELHPEYTYQPRKPSEKKRRMTKRKAAEMEARAKGAMPGDVQPSLQDQRQLPDFAFLPNNNELMELNVGQHPADVESMIQLITEHNNSQAQLGQSVATAVITTNGFDFEFGDISIAGMGGFGTGFEMENATHDRDAFAFVAPPTAEQERHELLSDEIFDWDAFK